MEQATKKEDAGQKVLTSLKHIKRPSENWLQVMSFPGDEDGIGREKRRWKGQ